MNISVFYLFVFFCFVFTQIVSLKGFCLKFRESDCMDFLHSGIWAITISVSTILIHSFIFVS